MADKSKKSGVKKEVPIGVKIISVLYYIGAALSVLFALGMIVAKPILISIPVFALLSGLIVVAVILFLGMAVLDFFIARGLWRAQKWARILIIIFAILAVLVALINLIGGKLNAIINLIVSGVIGGYLLFSKQVKKTFA